MTCEIHETVNKFVDAMIDEKTAEYGCRNGARAFTLGYVQGLLIDALRNGDQEAVLKQMNNRIIKMCKKQ